MGSIVRVLVPLLYLVDDPAYGYARHHAGRINMMLILPGSFPFRSAPSGKTRAAHSGRGFVIFALFAASFCIPAHAHIGPPYPIMQNRKVGPFNVEVWSN